MMPNPVTLGLSPKRFPPCWLRWRLHWTLPTASSPGVWGQPKLGKWTRYESASCKANMWPYVWVHRQRAEFCWVWPIEGGKLHGFSWFGLMILLLVTWKKIWASAHVMLPHMALGGIGRMAIFRSSSRLGYHSLYLFVAASAASQDMGVRLLHLPTCEAKLWTPKMDGFSIKRARPSSLCQAAGLSNRTVKIDDSWFRLD